MRTCAVRVFSSMTGSTYATRALNTSPAAASVRRLTSCPGARGRDPSRRCRAGPTAATRSAIVNASVERSTDCPSVTVRLMTVPPIGARSGMRAPSVPSCSSARTSFGVEADRAQMRERGAHLRALRDRLRVRDLALAVGGDLLLGELLLANRSCLGRGHRRLGGDVFPTRLTRLDALDFAQDLPFLDLVADADVEAYHPSGHRRSDDGEVILGGATEPTTWMSPASGRPFDPGGLERILARAPLGQRQVIAPVPFGRLRHGGFRLRARTLARPRCQERPRQPARRRDATQVRRRKSQLISPPSRDRAR